MSEAAVLLVEDDENLRTALTDTLRNGNYPVIPAGSGPEALSVLANEPVGLVLSDVQMRPMSGDELLRHVREIDPALPAVLMSAYGTIDDAVDIMRDGAVDYLVKPFATKKLLSVVRKHLRRRANDEFPIAADGKSRELFGIARRVATSGVTATLIGESGTGKEVVARYIHDHSDRSEQAFVAINCAAIPENMLEAVLFGHEKGAFTGAQTAHAGKFEQANGGTLLLDEVSEMDINLQAKILRVIQEREVERIGGNKTIPLDVRILATTNRDLREHMQTGRFREDLYYRLNVFPLHIPPLRHRPGDILPLANLSLSRHCGGGRQAPTLAQCAQNALLGFAWPGNVRQLDNVMQRSLVLAKDTLIQAADLNFEDGPELQVTGEPGPVLRQDLKKQEFKMIADAMAEEGGNRRAVADRLGISPRTLRYKLAQMREAGEFVDVERRNT